MSTGYTGETLPVEHRAYQADAHDAVFDHWTRGIHKVALVMPTGTGKTIVGGTIAKTGIKEFHRRTLFLAHREILVEQAAAKISKFGLSVQVEMANQDAFKIQRSTGAKADVVVGTVQSMQADRLLRWDREQFGQIIVDESHRIRAKQYQNVLAWFKNYWLLGITATLDGSATGNLGAVFEAKCYEYPLREAIEQGAVAQIRRETCMVSVDLRDLRTTGGDFNAGDLASRVGPKVEEIADGIQQRIGRRYTVVFTPDVGSAKMMAEMLTAKGTPARYVAGSAGDWGMPKGQRKAILEEYKQKSFQVIVCCDLLVEGWDMPHVSCVVIARPTRRRYRYVQMVGRGTRINKGEGEPEDCLLVDMDWETDASSKELCTEVSLFDDGTLDPDVVSFVGRRVKEDKTIDVLETIKEAVECVRIKKQLMVQITGRKAKFKTVVDNPAGVAKILDVKFKSRYDMDSRGNNPASHAQISYLKSLGVREPGNISKWGAAKLITALKKRHDQGMATTDQLKGLIDRGVDPAFARVMKRPDADRALSLTQDLLF